MRDESLEHYLAGQLSSSVAFEFDGRGIELRKETSAKNLGLLTADGAYSTLAQLLSDNSYEPVRAALFVGSDKTSTM